MTTARQQSRETSPAGEDSLLSHPLFGGGLPPLAEQYLSQAGDNYASDRVAEDYLSQAQELAPDHFAVLIGFYRYYFYKGRLQEALAISKICMAKAAREKNFATDWRAVQKEDAQFGDYDDVIARFFMFCLKGYAYLLLRLGDFAEGRAAIEKLLQLDTTDKINARLLIDILERQKAEEEQVDDE
jgi:tetratricopeptide (TPR) repeat protein